MGALSSAREEANRTIAALASKVAALHERISEAERAQAEADRSWADERKRYEADSAANARLVLLLRGTAGSDRAAVRRLATQLERLPSVPSSQLAVLKASRDTGSLHEALQQVADAFEKDMEAANFTESRKAQEFQGSASKSRTELAAMREDAADLTAELQLRQGSLPAMEAAHREEQGLMKRSLAVYDRIAGQCRDKQPIGAVGTSLPAKLLESQAGPFVRPNATELERLRLEMNDTFLAFVNASAGHAWGPPVAEYGPYGMEAIVNIPIQGFSGRCSAPNMGNIYLPTASLEGSMPPPGFLISYSHGFTEGGHIVDMKHRELLFRKLVAMGFVVVAHQTGGQHDYCDSSADQMHMVDWARTSVYSPRINFDRVALMGFSMGGRATLSNAAQADLMRRQNVKAVVLFMPHCNYGCGVPTVPSIFFAGGADMVASSEDAYKAYVAAQKDKIWVIRSLLGHNADPRQYSTLLTPDAGRFVACKMQDDQQSCAIWEAYPHCKYGCQFCGCEACQDCKPCWGPTPPRWCAQQCEAACSSCKSCSTCSFCTQ